MENVTDRTSNPFGMRPPCDAPGRDIQPAVFGYGDANADFHVIGDHPGIHGGQTTGIPFTGTVTGERLQHLLYALDFAAKPYSDEPILTNVFLSYIHICSTRDGRTPSSTSYADLERFFDAELRAINAHILLPVGPRATAYVLDEHTTQAGKLPREMVALHSRQIRGRGFLVVPIREPVEWDGDDEVRVLSTLEGLLESDYRQTKGVATTVG